MADVHSARATVRFGVFEADFRTGELRKNGARIKLQEQPLQILQMLLEHPGEVVTREDLRKKIWPADTFIAFEQGLYNSVKRLRGALEDSADKPRFIETLSRRGCRFVGSITSSPWLRNENSNAPSNSIRVTLRRISGLAPTST